MKKIINILTIAIIITFAGCQKIEINELLNQTDTNNYIENLSNGNNDIILGKKLKNPYTVQNMQKAYISLKNAGEINDYINIDTTHYYIKFKPQNFNAYNKLESNKKLIIYSYPLDYEILNQGNRYHDPSLPDTIPTYQYACVKKNFKFESDIPYEILDYLYIPEEDTKTKTNNKLINKLLKQAYIQTENYQDTLGLETKASNYTPSGTITVFDNRLQRVIGMEGLEIRTRRWFTTYKDITDFDGKYSVNGSFHGPCNYSIYFTDDKFFVKEHTYGGTYFIDGPKISGTWNYQLAQNYEQFQATIFRAAYRYHHKNIDGLRRPYLALGQKLNYVGVDGEKNWSGVNYLVLLKVARYYKDNSNVVREYKSDEIFSTTIHETAHTSHILTMNSGLIQYSQVSPLIKESWAIGVEWWLTKLEYKNQWLIPNYGDWNYSVNVQYPNQFAYQYWSKNYNINLINYSNLFIDLIDNYNEYNQYFGNLKGTIDDQVSGYTLSYIEQNIIKHSYGLQSLATNLKTYKPNGVTDTQIDLLLNNY